MDGGVWHEYLTRSYWAAGMPRPLLEKAIANSLCVGVYRPGPAAGGDPASSAGRPVMVGAGRVVTDRSTYAYLSDVFVLEAHRGRGLSKALMASILSHPELQGLRRFALFTRDAQGLYAQFGFEHCPHPERYMERKFGGYRADGTGPVPPGAAAGPPPIA